MTDKAKKVVMQKMNNKVRQATNGELSFEEVQHLKRRGVLIPNKTQSLSERPIRRCDIWWKKTPVEKFFEGVEFLPQKPFSLSIIILLVGIILISSLFGKWIGKRERWKNEIFSTWQVVNDATGDQSGVIKLALERLLRNKLSLAGFNLQDVNLSNANLQEANLSSASLQGANLEQANLQGANLSLASLQGVNLEQANLQRANLSLASLQKAYIPYAKLQRTYLIEANFQEANMPYTKLQGADLSYANFQEANLSLANFREANMPYAELQEANLSYANLQEVNLEQANLQGANLSYANLQGANLSYANLQGVNLWQANNLTSEQIKSACFWEKAIYKGKWNSQMETWVAIEAHNTNFIEELKKDTASDPKEAPDCSIWE